MAWGWAERTGRPACPRIWATSWTCWALAGTVALTLLKNRVNYDDHDDEVRLDNEEEMLMKSTHVALG
jgi:hypothetical protein